MLKRSITYTNFNDETVTEDFYFNFTNPELMEWSVEVDGGMGALLEKIIKENNQREILKHVKDIILRAYGEKSEDGRRFIKNDQLREEFSQSAAYVALYEELMTKENAASSFILAILPKDIAAQASEKTRAQMPTLPPPPPVTPQGA